jgi:dolichyl-diphosphooligosaccharide--protein glycosyltransferase
MTPPPKAHPADERPQLPGRIVTRASLWYWFLLALILLAALWLRVDDLIAWRHQPQRAFFDGQPLLISFDGYYYLSLARDLREGTYGAVDTLRGVPESPVRPMPPPLLSLLTAASPWSLNWTALLLPPLLGLTLAVPLMLFGRLYGGRLMALVAVAMGLFPSYYVYRSHMGWFDTDCLNVTFLLLICYLFIRFGLTAGPRRYAYLASGLAAYLLFLLWWDQTPAIVTLICLSPLAIVLLLYYRPKGRERRAALCVGLAALAGVAAWQGPRIIVAPFQQALGQLGYISKQQGDAFPNVGVSVHEQKKMALADMVEMSTGHPLSFALGLIGLTTLFWQQRRKAAALIVPFAIGALTFLFARRFLIFLTPFLAVGLGFAAQWLWQLRTCWMPLRYATPLLIAVLVFIPFQESLGKVYWPKEMPPMIAGMDRLARTTDKTALVWAWWDHGYPLLYWAERATINDGSLHGGVRTVSNAIPLAAENASLAARFMRFYATRGPGGLEKLFAAMQSPAKAMALTKEVLSAGPAAATGAIERAGLAPVQEWHAFFFPPATRDIYLFLDLRLARTTYWWYWFGTWDPDKRDGIHPVFKWLPNGRREGDTIQAEAFNVDLKQGTITIGQAAYPLAAAHIQDGQTWNEQRYTNGKGLIFTYHAPTRSGALMDRTFADSLFSQLYIYQKANPDFFSLHAENYPYFQIWRVQAEKPGGPE